MRTVTQIHGVSGQNGMFVKLLTNADVTDEESGLESAVAHVIAVGVVTVAHVKVKISNRGKNFEYINQLNFSKRSECMSLSSSTV